jgi:hypothetical protein
MLTQALMKNLLSLLSGLLFLVVLMTSAGSAQVTVNVDYFQDSFESGSTSAWTAGGGGSDTGTTSQVSQDRAHSGVYSWKAMATGTGGVKLHRWHASSVDHIETYRSVWIWWPSTLTITNDGCEYINLIQHRERNSPWNPTWNIVATRTTPTRTVDVLGLHDWYNGTIHHNDANAVVPKDQWFHVETYHKVGRSDGEITVWLNGLQIFNLTGINTAGGTYNTYSQFAINNYSYCGSGIGHPIYFDDVKITNYRVGGAPVTPQAPTNLTIH